MPETDISKTTSGSLETTGTDYSVHSADTDGATEQRETEWTNTRWSIQLGYYKNIQELKKAINAKATWTIGKGIKADPETTFIMQSIRGFGKDTFNTILENDVRVYHIGGDSFSEIIRDKEGNLANLKPLDPSVMKIIANRQGIIIRYEQVSKVKEKPNKKFKPEQIFHLSKDRVADEIHGESIVDAVEDDILAIKEAKADMKKLMHRHVKPVVVFKLDTDDQTKIDAFKTKADAVTDKGENIFIPMGAVDFEVLSVATNATLNPLPWIQQLNNSFWQAVGVPQIIVGGSQELTEATAKIAYLAFEQTIEEEQLYIEEQVGMQLGLKIELEFPASLVNDLLTGEGKSESTQAATPEDTTASEKGVTPQKGTQ